MNAQSITGVKWRDDVADRVAAGARFAGLYGTTVAEGCRLTAVLAVPGGFELVAVVVSAADGFRYPSLTVRVPAAFWWERAAADLSGVVPVGHPRPDPLLLHVGDGTARPQPGRGRTDTNSPGLQQATPPGPIDVIGRGLFTIAYGPVRSGVTETIEYLVETPGEDIPRVNIRPHFKHRGVAKAFEERTLVDAALVAERVEGIATIAHATAYAHAVETLTGIRPPHRAALVRVVLAELERIANHLDVAMKLADAAGLAVAVARFGWHKETVMRLMGQATGSRFGRGAVTPGGVSPTLPLTADAPGRMSPADLAVAVRQLQERVRADEKLAMRTPSFLDRLRGTGRLDPAHALLWGAVGPIGRASGVDDDNRWTRPTDAYPDLTARLRPAVTTEADTLARLRVRWDELHTSVQLITRACEQLQQLPRDAVHTPVPAGASGVAIGWAEGPQGEVISVLEAQVGRVVRCFARTPALHNLVLFHDVFHGDVLTDFAFIEAGFGLSPAGVAM